MINKTALVTGGSDRIGKEIALSLAEMGYNIALHYNSSAHNAQQTRDLLISKKVDCKIYKANFQDSDQVVQMFDSVFKEMNVEILVNNSSMFFESSLADNNFSNYDTFFNVNFKAAYLLTKLFALNYRNGLIINILDALSSKNKTKNFDYLLTKKCLSEFTRMSAVELAPGIRVNGIAPGIILPPAGKDFDYINRLAQNTPLKKVGSLDDIGEAVKFLVKNNFITGQIIYVDGGMNL